MVPLLPMLLFLGALLACEPRQPDDPPMPPVDQLPPPPPVEQGAMPLPQPPLATEPDDDALAIPPARLHHLVEYIEARHLGLTQAYQALARRYERAADEGTLTRRSDERYDDLRRRADTLLEEQQLFIDGHGDLVERQDPLITDDERRALSAAAHHLVETHRQLRSRHEDLAGIYFDDDRDDLRRIHNRFVGLHRDLEALLLRLVAPEQPQP